MFQTKELHDDGKSFHPNLLSHKLHPTPFISTKLGIYSYLHKPYYPPQSSSWHLA